MAQTKKVGTGTHADADANVETDPEEIIQNSKTLNLSEDDEKFLTRFVKAFIKSAEKEFLKPSSRTHLESFAKVCTTFTGVAIGTAPGLGVGSSIVKAAVKTVNSAITNVLDAKKIVDHKNAGREVNNFLIRNDKGNTDPAEVILRQFLAKISTDIFLRYIEQIKQWTSTHGYIYIDEIGDVFGQRCCYKLKQIDLKNGDTYDSIVQKFIGSDNIGKTIENWFLETTKFKVEDYRSIFHEPLPALYVRGQLKVKPKVNDNAGNALQKSNEPIAPKWFVQGDNLLEQLRPPFNFEQRDMEANEKDLITVNVKTTVTNINIKKFVWEDPTPLASKICKKLEVELNPFKKIRVEAEKHKDEMLDAQGKTQFTVDKLFVIQKRSESLNKIKPKSSAANPVSYFTGREALLEEIHKKLKKCNLTRTGSNASSSGIGTGSGFATGTKLSDKMVFLVGPEGYGKTETAKKYAKTYLKEYYTNIIWIDAGSFESLKRSFEKTAREWGIDPCGTAPIQVKNKSYDYDADQKRVTKLCQVVYQHFIDVGSQQNSLFIFDNAQQMTNGDRKGSGFAISKFLPQQQGGFLPIFLVTSSNCNWGSSSHVENVVRIEKLPQSETRSLLNTRFDIKTEDSKSAEYGGLQESLTELAKILDGFPLGLDIIASSILGNIEQDQ